MPDAASERRRLEHALERTRAQLRRVDLAAALLFDPVNVRYVTGTSLFPVWTFHSTDRFVLVPVESPPILWEYAGAPPDTSASALPGLTVRDAPLWAPFGRGEQAYDDARAAASAIEAVLAERNLAGERIGVDRVHALALLALQAAGIAVADAQLALERARAVKSPEEIEAMRRSARICDEAVAHLYEFLRPGLTENELWAAFLGHAFAAGAEYAETRLLSSGPRTNPWFHEASGRAVEAGDLVAFDTDLIGPQGFLADISRTYLVPGKEPRGEQRHLYATAHDFLQQIVAELRPGAALDELGERLARRMPAEFHPQRYPFIAHGSGLSDEYPAIRFDRHHEGEIEANTVLSVEAYVGAVGGDDGVKLEEEVLVTENGVELLSHAPHDERLLG